MNLPAFVGTNMSLTICNIFKKGWLAAPEGKLWKSEVDKKRVNDRSRKYKSLTGSGSPHKASEILVSKILLTNWGVTVFYNFINIMF